MLSLAATLCLYQGNFKFLGLNETMVTKVVCSCAVDAKINLSKP